MKSIHKVKIMGESEYTECGLRFINTGLVATENGKVTCKKCSENQGGTKK